MKKKVRLYQKIDRDLMILHKNPAFSLNKALVQALHNAVYGEVTYIKIPDMINIKDVPKKMEVIVTIEDPVVMRWIESIPLGRRNDLMKNLLRGYLTGPVIYPYTSVEDPVIDLMNSPQKPIIECKKHAKEYIKETEYEYEELKKTLGKIGKSPKEFLEMLEKDAVDEAKEIIKTEQTETKPKVEPKEEPEEEPKEPPAFSTVEDDEEFDLMGSLKGLTD